MGGTLDFSSENIQKSVPWVYKIFNAKQAFYSTLIFCSLLYVAMTYGSHASTMQALEVSTFCAPIVFFLFSLPAMFGQFAVEFFQQNMSHNVHAVKLYPSVSFLPIVFLPVPTSPPRMSLADREAIQPLG